MRLAWLLATSLLIVSPVVAQFDSASVLGVLKDSSGAPVPGAQVVLRNVDTGVTATVQSSAQGDYQFPTAKIGNYQLTAEHQGFSKSVVDGITLTVNARQRVDVTL